MLPPQNYFATRFGGPAVSALPARPAMPAQPFSLSMPARMGAPKFPVFQPRPQFGGMQMPQPTPMPASAPQNAIAARLGMAF